MSQPFSRFLHPFDVAHHPSMEPEVKRASRDMGIGSLSRPTSSYASKAAGRQSDRSCR
jgi:hypothetical protein